MDSSSTQRSKLQFEVDGQQNFEQKQNLTKLALAITCKWIANIACSFSS